MFVVIFLCCFLYSQGQSEVESPLYGSVYITINQNIAACYRRMDNKNVFGCQSKRSGNVGILKFLEGTSPTDAVSTFLKSTDSSQEYIAVLNGTQFLQRKVLEELVESGRATGFLVFKSEKAFSADGKYPNKAVYSWAASTEVENLVEYNPDGRDLLKIQLNAPVIMLKSSDQINTVVKHIHENEGASAASLFSFNSGATPSSRCIKRSEGDLLSITTALQRCKAISNTLFIGSPDLTLDADVNKVVIVAARFDTRTFFDYEDAVGAEAYTTGVAALLAIADAMRQLNSSFVFKQRILFVLYEGEYFDNMASVRFAYQLENDKFTWVEWLKSFTLSNISIFIELSQVGLPEGNSPLSYQVLQYGSDPIDNFTKALNQSSREVSFMKTKLSSINQMPPSSFFPFIKSMKEAFQGVIIADHSTKRFKTEDYASYTDTEENLWGESKHGLSNLAKLSSTIFHTLVNQYSINSTIPDASINDTYLEMVWNCLTNKQDYKMFCNQLIAASPNDTYSVNRQASSAPNSNARWMATALLTYSLHYSATNDTSCKHEIVKSVASIKLDGTCYKAFVQFNLADPIKDTPAYWAESFWQEPKLLLFFQSSSFFNWSVFGLGVISLIFYLVLGLWINAKTDVLFGEVEEPDVNVATAWVFA